VLLNRADTFFGMLPQLRAAIEAGHIDAVAALVITADEKQRSTLADLLMTTTFPRPSQAMIDPPGEPSSAPDTTSEDIRRDTVTRWEGALRVAGTGCLPGTDDVVAWLRSERFSHAPDRRTLDALLRVLQSPGRPPLEEVADAMAAGLLPFDVDHQWPLIAALLNAEGASPRPSEAVLRGWLRALRFDDDPAAITERLRADPWTWLLLPHLFTIEGLGTELTAPAVAALEQLCRTGGYSRASMLTSLRWRLRTGDESGDIRPFIALHHLLSPTAEEINAHVKEYFGLLTNPELRTAELALATLRRADDAGQQAGQKESIVAEVTRAVLARPRPELVRALLDWLDTALRWPTLQVFQAVQLCQASDSAEIVAQTRQMMNRHQPARSPSEPGTPPS
jgi:hypothetical protein